MMQNPIKRLFIQGGNAFIGFYVKGSYGSKWRIVNAYYGWKWRPSCMEISEEFIIQYKDNLKFLYKENLCQMNQ